MKTNVSSRLIMCTDNTITSCLTLVTVSQDLCSPSGTLSGWCQHMHFATVTDFGELIPFTAMLQVVHTRKLKRFQQNCFGSQALSVAKRTGHRKHYTQTEAESEQPPLIYRPKNNQPISGERLRVKRTNEREEWSILNRRLVERDIIREPSHRSYPIGYRAAGVIVPRVKEGRRERGRASGFE